METYLVSVEPTLFSAVVANLQQQHIQILYEMNEISILSVSCNPEQKNWVAQLNGVLAIEKEGTSFAI